jgi:broad specificity phosphatase PhoE
MTQTFIRYADLVHTNNLYEDYYQSGLLKGNPDLSENGKLKTAKYAREVVKKNIVNIFFSPSAACRQTALLINDTLNCNMVELPLLQNLKHDFSLLTKKELWIDSCPTQKTLIDLRMEFFRQFQNNLLLENTTDCIKRIELIYNFSIKNENSLYITHGIILKLLELHIRSNCQSFQLESTLSYTDFEKPFFSSLKGFEINGLQDI